MTAIEIRQILEAPYNRQVWKSFIQTQFTNNNLLANDAPLDLGNSELHTECIALGNYEVDEYTKIGIFEVKLKNNVKLSRNRVGLRNLIKGITGQLAGVMVVFVQGDKWRFSYVSIQIVKNKETNQIKSQQTAPKRYTYLFGKNEKARTAAIRFEQLIQKQRGNRLNLNDFEEAFSVEKLSKEFFAKYKEIYEDFVEYVTGKRFKKSGNKYVEQTTKDPNYQLRNLFNNDEKQARDFCKRMMGRIVFLYFIQKKGWLAVAQGKKWGEGNQDYLFDLYTTSKHKDDFYTQELVPLFFRTLNNTDSEKETNVLRFPYLNGGLFDDSQDRKHNNLAMPTALFAKLFDTFNEFNFTIYEDAPDEQTVAVDPEMLGHIFENLLEDNKDKGAFYTPKEIVHYMCRESLGQFIIGKLLIVNEAEQATIKKIIEQAELSKNEMLFAERNAFKIIDALENVKICDPAIGSGAFPMGLLQEIFNTLIYLQELKGFARKQTEAQIKKHIIEESIYGVDIDAGAVDIARLRFWLSLVVDETEPQPLPNLAFKIVCANTLIPLGKLENNLLVDDNTITALANVRHEYFVASHQQKKELEVQFKNLQKGLLKNIAFGDKTQQDILTKLYNFNPFGDHSNTWFDAWWMFGVKDGFDIVIGNPPYVQLQKDGGKLAKMFEKCGYKSFERTGDIYALFYEKGIELLKQNGHLCFITSNKWMRAGYGESLREVLAKQNPVLLLDLGPGIFENATVDSNILLLQKNTNQLKTVACIAKEKDTDLDAQKTKSGMLTKFNNKESWVILNPIEQSIKEKIERLGTPLKDWDIQINYGIKTGYNEAFIIDGAKKDELIEADPKSVEIIRPILRGRDIKRYGYEFADKWIIATFPSLKIDIESYPAIKQHLLSFGYDRLKQTGDKDARKRTNNKWFETQDSIGYWEDFYKQKIIWIELVDKGRFALDTSNLYLTLNGTFIMTGENLEFIACILNSPITSWHFNTFCVSSGMGTSQWRELYVKELFIPKISYKTKLQFINLVEGIIETEENRNSALNKISEINQIVYQLYQLNEDEITFIESQ